MNLSILDPLNYSCYAIKEDKVAVASAELKTLMPNIDFERNLDLFGVVYEGAVVGVFNQNDDGIDTEEALQTYKDFLHKPVNIRHDMMDVVGSIVNVGLSEYQGSAVLTEEEAAQKDIFCISMASVVYLRVPTYDCYKIVESTNPDSPSFHGMSASWEIMFTDYDIAICDSKDTTVAQAERVTRDDSRFMGLVYSLRAFGGSGVLKDGKYVKRILKKTLPGGIGFTETPAADVQGITAVIEGDKSGWFDSALGYENLFENQEASASILYKKSEDGVKIEENLTQTVIIDNDQTNMDEKTIKNVVDTHLASTASVAVATSLTNELVACMQKGAQEMVEKVETKTKEVETLTAKASEQAEQLKAQADELASVKSKLFELETAQAQAQAQAEFQNRFSQVSEKFEVSEAQRAFIVEDVKACASEEAFASLMQKYETMLTAKASKQEPEKTEKEKLQEAQASIQEEISNPAAQEPGSKTLEGLKATLSQASIKVTNK